MSCRRSGGSHWTNDEHARGLGTEQADAAVGGRDDVVQTRLQPGAPEKGFDPGRSAWAHETAQEVLDPSEKNRYRPVKTATKDSRKSSPISVERKPRTSLEARIHVLGLRHWRPKPLAAPNEGLPLQAIAVLAQSQLFSAG